MAFDAAMDDRFGFFSFGEEQPPPEGASILNGLNRIARVLVAALLTILIVLSVRASEGGRANTGLLSGCVFLKTACCPAGVSGDAPLPSGCSLHIPAFAP